MVSSDCCVVEIDWWLLGDKKSSVVAHISEEGVFTGMVATSDEVYHIEVCVCEWVRACMRVCCIKSALYFVQYFPSSAIAQVHQGTTQLPHDWL